jgi:hypothetical protein
MTERLYYHDAALTEFDASVLQVVTAPDGRRAVVLDRTAFYPTSGGQPFDTGTIGSARVVDVIDQDDGTILHVVEGRLDPGPVHGRIDRDRRFDHMQQTRAARAFGGVRPRAGREDLQLPSEQICPRSICPVRCWRATSSEPRRQRTRSSGRTVWLR